MRPLVSLVLLAALVPMAVMLYLSISMVEDGPGSSGTGNVADRAAAAQLAEAHKTIQALEARLRSVDAATSDTAGAGGDAAAARTGRLAHTPFIILFEGRSGSSHLIHMLRTVPGVRAEGEILNEMPPKDDGAAGWAQRVHAFLRRDGPNYELVRKDDGSEKAVGFKFSIKQIAWKGRQEALWEPLEQTRARVICMIRMNRVESIVSRLRMFSLFEKCKVHSQMLKANDVCSADEMQLGPAPVDLERFDSELRMRERSDAMLLRYCQQAGEHDLPVMWLTYEELLADEVGSLRRVLDFINIPSADMDLAAIAKSGAITSKVTPSLKTSVSNYDELRAHLQGTQYADSLSEAEGEPRPSCYFPIWHGTSAERFGGCRVPEKGPFQGFFPNQGDLEGFK